MSSEFFALGLSPYTFLLTKGTFVDKWLILSVITILACGMWWFMWGRFSSLEEINTFFTQRQDYGGFVQA